MSSEKRKGPKPLGDVLSAVMSRYGITNLTGRAELEDVWAKVAGPYAAATKVGALRHGTLEVLVDSAVALQELNGFHRRDMLRHLQAGLLHSQVDELRFKRST